MKPYVTAQITIDAPKEKVWDALTNPDMTVQYMFGCRVRTDWQLEGKVEWVGMAEGEEIVYVSGDLIVYEPYLKLTYSVIDPSATYLQTRKNHLMVEHTLAEDNGSTLLTVTQGDYTEVADGEHRYGEDPEAGWLQLLTQIKEIVEKQ